MQKNINGDFMKLTFKLSFIFFILLIVSGVVTLVVLLNINQRKSEVLICEVKQIKNVDYQICNLKNGSKMTAWLGSCTN